MPEISVLVEGGKATASAPLGPALGPLGVNIGEVVNQINEKTKSYAGMKVPVKVIVDSSTREFEIKVGSPPMSGLIKKELGIEKAAANPKTDVAGNLSIEQVKKIAKMKIDSLASAELKSAAKEVIGACNSMGVTIDGKKAKQVQDEIKEGKYDSAFAAPAATEASIEKKEVKEEEQVEKKNEEAKSQENAEAEKKEEKPAEEKEKIGEKGKEVKEEKIEKKEEKAEEKKDEKS